jgi:2-oxoglutarate/2-oxoacid ferredoxin oxidoreductase subunit beta
VDKDLTPNHLHAIVSGIGCTGRSAGYVKLDSYHTTHGRAIAFATGLKLARKDLKVSVISGDGDLATIGGNHLIHAARRNIDITVIFNNNFIYGMTGGQYSATTPHGAYSSSSKQGNFEKPFNMVSLMKAAGATYIARWTTLHVKQLEESISRALEHRGFAFIEVISPCPTQFGRNNKYKSPLDTMKYFQNNSVSKDQIHLDTFNISMNPLEDIVVGEFYQDEDLSNSYTNLDFIK